MSMIVLAVAVVTVVEVQVNQNDLEGEEKPAASTLPNSISSWFFSVFPIMEAVAEEIQAAEPDVRGTVGVSVQRVV